jgi:hypothetical protein
MTELADKIERSEPSRDLDAEIYQSLNPHMKPITPVKQHRGRFFDPTKALLRTAREYHLARGATAIAPHYTTSLDAAMTLARNPAFEKYGGAIAILRWAIDNLRTSGGEPEELARFVTAACLRAKGGE